MTRTQFAEPAQKAAIVPHAQRRGACPSLAAPMLTSDGLLARLRPAGRTLRPAQLERIAMLAAEFGNGQIEVTARGNLQVRGLRAGTAALFAEAVEDAVEIETGLPIDISPLAGLDPLEIMDPRPLAAEIAKLATESGLADRLGPKVCVIVDGGGTIGLADLGADVRLVAMARGDTRWMLDIARDRLGMVPAADAPGAVLGILEMIAAIGVDARARDLDTATVRTALGSIGIHPAPSDAPPALSHTGPLEGNPALGGKPFPLPVARIGLAFGSADWSSLIELAHAANHCGISEFRLAPGHAIIAMAVTETMAETFRQAAAALGFITGPNDVRATISACVGDAGCASGALPARAIAAGLAARHPEFFDGSFALHVSGCAKGCAHPRKALLTLVGNDQDCHLILNATAGAVPLARFAQAGIEPAMERLATLWRDNRALGESVAACFKRLGETAVVAAVRQG